MQCYSPLPKASYSFLRRPFQFKNGMSMVPQTLQDTRQFTNGPEMRRPHPSRTYVLQATLLCLCPVQREKRRLQEILLHTYVLLKHWKVTPLRMNQMHVIKSTATSQSRLMTQSWPGTAPYTNVYTAATQPCMIRVSAASMSALCRAVPEVELREPLSIARTINAMSGIAARKQVLQEALVELISMPYTIVDWQRCKADVKVECCWSLLVCG